MSWSENEILVYLFELSNLDQGNVMFEVGGGDNKQLFKFFKLNQRELEQNDGKDDKIVLPIKIDDRFYHLDLTSFNNPPADKNKTPILSPRSPGSTRTYTDRGSTIKKQTNLKSKSEGVKIT